MRHPTSRGWFDEVDRLYPGSRPGSLPRAGNPVWVQVRALSGFRIHVETELPGAEGKKVNFADAKRSYANKTSFELARSLMMCAVR
jgi:hypothetical protein